MLDKSRGSSIAHNREIKHNFFKAVLAKAWFAVLPSLMGPNWLVNKPIKFLAAGLALVPEGRGVFGELSVAENLKLGAYTPHARQNESKNLERVYELFPKLNLRARQTVRTMSRSEQQMVAIGRAMMSDPKILALDEPSLGL